MLNPTLYINKVKFTVNRPGEAEPENYEPEEEEKPLVFDDPATQTVEFKDNGEAVVIDEGYQNEDNNVKPGFLSSIRKKKEPEVKPEETEKAADSDIDMAIEVAKGDTETADKKTLVEDIENMEPYDPKRDLENYHYPTLDLLKKYDNDGKPYIDMAEQTANKNRIVDVLRTFGVEISSIKATVGPTITLYEITLAQGVRIQKVKNLEDDIALSLAALGIRIIAPMPGKGTVGIEVPNAKPSTVSMESILNSKKFQESKMELPCAIGKTITNEVFMFDLAKAPHLLVAGATGQGKSVGLNAIITSLLYKKHPAELKIVLVDPKKVEFSFYEPIANHFLAKVPDEEADPIITDVTKVVRTLNSLCKEMDTRYDLLKIARAHNIKEYNQKFIARQLNPNNGHRFLPYIVVVIDEFGDLIMTAGKEVELPIARIAQLARAVGIHMIIATQRPTTNIITGTIKANFPSRIAFKVSAGIDSKTILDRTGAQQLIGRGDMLALVGGSEPERVQCAFVDTPEVERINEYISDQQSYGAPFELPEPDMPEADMGDGGDRDVDMAHLDPLFDDAARLIVMNQSGSTSLIQRKFAIGYNRAGRLMDQLEKAGVVGAAMGSKPREVLIQDENSLNNLLSNLR
jgi:S-DNA-T family DNA segregation ATPase FtsK/SpoIIIE